MKNIGKLVGERMKVLQIQRLILITLGKYICQHMFQ